MNNYAVTWRFSLWQEVFSGTLRSIYGRSLIAWQAKAAGRCTELMESVWGRRAADGVHILDGCKTLINVGSVGQPRDGDWRACYVLLDGPRVTFRGVEYDVDETVRRIHAIPQLDRRLGDRLRTGSLGFSEAKIIWMALSPATGLCTGIAASFVPIFPNRSLRLGTHHHVNMLLADGLPVSQEQFTANLPVIGATFMLRFLRLTPECDAQIIHTTLTFDEVIQDPLPIAGEDRHTLG